jgi:hypothetical protein
MRLNYRCSLASSCLVAGAIACGPAPHPRDQTPRDPDPVTVESRTSLRAAFGEEDVNVVGVTVDPNTGARYVMDADRGLFELTGGGVELIADLDMLVPSDRALSSPFTDVAALGDGKFAMTAANDGFLLDLDQQTFESYFCYVPGEIIDEYAPMPIVQLTRSLTYDPESRLLFAQPQTFGNDTTGEVLRSQIGQFLPSGGEGFGWMEIEDTDFLAGGIATAEGQTLLLGKGSKLYPYEMNALSFDEAIDLAEYGIAAIDGMVRIPGTDRMLIVDALSDELVEITLR